MIKKAYNWASSWTGTVIIVLVIIFFVAQAFVIPSGSMKNSLLIGDMLFVKKFSYGVPVPRIPWLEVPILPDFKGDGHLIDGDKPQRGDIVVFRYPHNDKVHYVKRCVATGGDLVLIQNKNLLLHPSEGNEYVKKNYPEDQIIDVEGQLWIINPYQRKHPGIHHDPNVVNNGLAPAALFNMLPIKVPKGEYFMMGDNRDHSNDSRFWGTVEYKYIVGKPWFIYFSWDKDKKVRWDRVFRTVESIEKDLIGKKVDINHEKGIY
ncbi:signal peptidase I [Arcobacter sp. CECT 8986]|uniref:signal peptidase I n=1 Tax=Arcobacter sp. CECT 8986 TaxID=2044507 RepID=UPI001009A0DA|nr:signal peptidase I [Arcobacter sp. CECT 8986]RXJ98883.1 signal peptidase I [Arcobacter sp. CECT 8986]